jgi:FixJ family two-component response regulator
MNARPVILPGIVHVVDDDHAFRKAMGRLLTAAGHTPLLYASADEYLACDDDRGPACVLLDLRMRGRNGLELQTALARREDARPVIFVSAHADIPSTVEAMRGGALDFLTKPVPTGVLLHAIDGALKRDIEREARRARREEVKRLYSTLTPRERQVMAGVVAGRLNKQICFALNSAERTVKTHRARVMDKMEVRSVAELVRLAAELGAAGIALEPVPGD